MLVGPITPKTPFERIFREVEADVRTELAEMTNRVLGQPAANYLEKEDCYIVEVAVPGLEKKDLDVAVKNRQLVVSAKVRKLIDNDVEEPAPRFKFREFGFSGFERKFALPMDAEVDNITARCTRGVLSLFIPRRIEDEGISISID